MKNRIDHIDIAKGISLILVVLYHSKLQSMYHNISNDLSVLRMPLFFFLSGVFFSYRQELSVFISRKFQGLLKPYFSILLLLLVIYTAMGESNGWGELLGIFYGGHPAMLRWGSVWFLSHLFVVFLCTYLLYRYTAFTKLKKSYQWLFVLLSYFGGALSLGFIGQAELPLPDAVTLPWRREQMPLLLGLPFSVDLLPVTMAYFIAGILLRAQVQSDKLNPVLLTTAFIGFAAVSLATEAQVHFPIRTIVSPAYALLGTIFGIYIALQASIFIARIPPAKKAIDLVGQSSLFILIFHFPILKEATQIMAQLVGSYAMLTPVHIVPPILMAICIPIVIRGIIIRSDLLSLLFIPVSDNNPYYQRLTRAVQAYRLAWQKG